MTVQIVISPATTVREKSAAAYFGVFGQEVSGAAL